MGPNLTPTGDYPEPESGRSTEAHLPALSYSALKPSTYCAHDLGFERQLETLHLVQNRYVNCIFQLDKAAGLLLRSLSRMPTVTSTDLVEAKNSLVLASDRLGTALSHLKNCDLMACTQRAIETIDSAIKMHVNSVSNLIPDCNDSQANNLTQACAIIAAESDKIRQTSAALMLHRERVNEAIKAKEQELLPPKSA